MMLLETQRIEARDDVAPTHFGRCFAAPSTSPAEVLSRIQEAWRVVATWGRWCDVDVGEWPEVDEMLHRLPLWLSRHLRGVPRYEVENWAEVLHDRSWIWWRAGSSAAAIQIELNAESLPLSWWPLQLVATAAGAGELRAIG